MAVKVKNLIVAHKAQINKQLGGAIDILGAFSEMVQPVFPFPMKNLSMVLELDGLERNTMFEMRLNGPEDELISKGEFGIAASPFGTGKKVIDIENFLITERGRYTLDLLEKKPEGLKFVQSCDLFIAAYPPQRRFSEEEIKKIMDDENLIKTVKTEFRPFGTKESVKLQLNLQRDMVIEEEFTAFPIDDKISLDGKEHDLTGLRRQIEWMFGRPIPKSEDPKENN
ncbi:hypothetical protein [uncultured Ilyobacter sp.]|uniref:hypothetical protein n=1 Tax=uncultured Ilyobacter sp. TaxID=544433 RepID=UPI0029C0D79D|nr:hypothetical protein [uncultured Ilyobacter sp.]